MKSKTPRPRRCTVPGWFIAARSDRPSVYRSGLPDARSPADRAPIARRSLRGWSCTAGGAMLGRAMQQLPYGRWRSPIDADALASALRLEELRWSDEGTLFWVEARDGRGVLMSTLGGRSPVCELTSAAHDVRGRVGYGGGALAVAADRVVFADRGGQLFSAPAGQALARPLTPPGGSCAAPALSRDGRWLVYVHHDGRDDRLLLVDAAGQQTARPLVSGSDFYLDPVWHPDGQRLAWIEWDHPNMPWQSSRLLLATLASSGEALTVVRRELIAGGPGASVLQPQFSADGRYLGFVSDSSGWSELHLHELSSGVQRQLTHLRHELAPPAWVQGMRHWGFAHDGRSALAAVNDAGFQRVERIDLASGQGTRVPGLEAYTAVSSLVPAPHADALALVAASSRSPPRLLLWRGGDAAVVRPSTGLALAAAALAEAQPLSWQADDGLRVHALLYTPTSAEHHDASGALPPAIIGIHGGPTAQSGATFNARAQYFATRGWVFLELNHRGSSGYGRAYQQALDGRWGVVDVEDTLGAREYLVGAGLADPRRIVVMGGSAGGFTVLETLCTHPARFAAGVCLYGVSDLLALTADTHKFEAHYLDSLVGELPATAARYRQRSPLHHAERIEDALILFQGSEDRVVPPDQSERIAAVLRRRGIPCEYHLYAGEEHGFRQPATLRRFYRDLERFLDQQVLQRRDVGDHVEG
ncbi:MAG: S9 family peptidase [Proteobacteria bacterium]|nr:S9 family peptidase [Pseudomonadota bacterium]